MRVFEAIEKASRFLNRVGAAIAVALIIYMFGHIIVEIAMRLFGRSTFILDEYIGYAVATMAFLGLPYVLEKGGLIRVSLLMDRVPGPARWPLELFSSLATAGCFFWLSTFWLQNVQRSYQRGVVSETLAETPIWIPESAILIGMWLISLTLLVRAFKIALLRSRYSSHTA
ncbi:MULTISPECIES: TRAP transporter small permease [unclassified Halomonas]|uniref:TRAP transporter small permease n=1 Tax=unclassified Halomonas TaxID=2609666 RepID=UPI0020766C20|nr:MULTISPECIES: TRAP transporter small permease [unclassified Halomonas]